MIREAETTDIPRIIEMGSRSLREGPYKDQIADNPEQATVTALQVIESSEGRILLAEEDGQVIGLVGFVVFPNYFTGEPTGNEIMWWVEPECRKKFPFTAIALFRAAERIARDECGATKMCFTAPTQEVGKMYEMLGYSPVEVAYQKALN